MEQMIIEKSEDTPKVILDPERGRFEFSERSLPEDATAFYGPILQWIGNYAQSPCPATEVFFTMEYFNTASSKLILDVLSALEEIKSMKILWYFHDDDEDMEEAGQEFSELVEIPFEFKTY